MQTVPRPLTASMAKALTATLDNLEKQKKPPPAWGRDHILPDFSLFRKFVEQDPPNLVGWIHLQENTYSTPIRFDILNSGQFSFSLYSKPCHYHGSRPLSSSFKYFLPNLTIGFAQYEYLKGSHYRIAWNHPLVFDLQRFVVGWHIAPKQAFSRNLVILDKVWVECKRLNWH